MSNKNKGGRETRKPKQDQNKKVKGQTPSPIAAAVDTAPASRAPRKK